MNPSPKSHTARGEIHSPGDGNNAPQQPSEKPSAASIPAQEALMIELIRQALGKIARETSAWPRVGAAASASEASIIEAVTDASEALEALERTLEARSV